MKMIARLSLISFALVLGAVSQAAAPVAGAWPTGLKQLTRKARVSTTAVVQTPRPGPQTVRGHVTMIHVTDGDAFFAFLDAEDGRSVALSAHNPSALSALETAMQSNFTVEFMGIEMDKRGAMGPYHTKWAATVTPFVPLTVVIMK